MPPIQLSEATNAPQLSSPIPRGVCPSPQQQYTFSGSNCPKTVGKDELWELLLNELALEAELALDAPELIELSPEL